MKSLSRKLIILPLVALLAMSGSAVADEDPHAKHRAMMQQKSEPAVESADIDLRDRLLVDHNGQDVQFVTDVVGDNIVAIPVALDAHVGRRPGAPGGYRRARDDLRGRRRAGLRSRARQGPSKTGANPERRWCRVPATRQADRERRRCE